MSMPETYKHMLLKIARKSIEISLDDGDPSPPPDQVLGSLDISSDEMPPMLTEKRGTFVTLTKDGELRGCIGHIEPVQPVYIDVVENACSAAFNDPRFPPVSGNELHSLNIEVSLLSVPVEMHYGDADELLQKLVPGRHGLILKKGLRSSTFLPQVWEQLPSKEEFLSHLCMKAGLPPDEWRSGGLSVKTYEAEHFSE